MTIKGVLHHPPLLPPRLELAQHALNLRHRARVLFRRAGRKRRRIAAMDARRGAGAMPPAGSLLAPAPVFFAVADELVDAARQLVAEFVDVLRHRVVVRRFWRGWQVRLGRLSLRSFVSIDDLQACVNRSPRRNGAEFSLPLFAPRTKCEGVERRKAQPLNSLPFGRRAFGARRLPALHRGFSVPGAVTSGRGREAAPSPIRAAFAALRPRRVQPLKAAPRSWGGRRPGASRGRGYEPRPQAPHPPRVLQRPAGRPSRGEGDRGI